tara:strand:+ start:460 stop:981 length:522 start_codon:yes stop_codon:yes gene_type:complete
MVNTVGVSLVTILAGCTSLSGVKTTPEDSTMEVKEKHRTVRFEEDNYLKKCYTHVPEKAIVGLTSPFVATAAPFYHAINQNEGDGFDEIKNRAKAFGYGTIESGALLLGGIYNTVGIILPLPCGTSLMKGIAEKANEKIYDTVNKQLDEKIEDGYHKMGFMCPLDIHEVNRSK